MNGRSLGTGTAGSKRSLAKTAKGTQVHIISMKKLPAKTKKPQPATVGYSSLVGGVSELLEAARRASVRSVNALMTATYWEIGRRIVEFEQGGEKRAEYGEVLLERLAADLTRRHGRGFARPNLIRFRQFYSAFPATSIRSTLSNESASPQICSKPPGIPPPALTLPEIARAFPLPWSHYVLLVSGSRSPEALAFYHTEALRGGWSVRQLRRQMDRQLNYAAEHWTQPGENPPVGIILCAGKGEALARYATDYLPNKVLVRDYLTALPDEKRLASEIAIARRQFDNRSPGQ